MLQKTYEYINGQLKEKIKTPNYTQNSSIILSDDIISFKSAYLAYGLGFVGCTVGLCNIVYCATSEDRNEYTVERTRTNPLKLASAEQIPTATIHELHEFLVTNYNIFIKVIPVLGVNCHKFNFRFTVLEYIDTLGFENRDRIEKITTTSPALPYKTFNQCLSAGLDFAVEYLWGRLSKTKNR